MTNASRDHNRVPTGLGTSASDGKTTLPIRADASTHALLVSDGTTGSGFSRRDSFRDENSVTAMIAMSTDGVTPVLLYMDSSSNLLIKST